VKSDMHIVVHTYLAMQMHIAIYGVGMAFLSFFPDDGACLAGEGIRTVR